MKPNVYIDGREGSGSSGSPAVDYIIFDVGLERTVAFITLPIAPDDFTPQTVWAKNALASLVDEEVCKAAANKGLIEFEVADVKTGRLFTVSDVVVELEQAVSRLDGISDGARRRSEC